MDWAEELKMSIRKTARKGRRSKSRDLLNSSSITASTATSSIENADIAVDITLDLPQSTTSPSIVTPGSSSNNFLDQDMKQRPPVRRISGGWADSSGLKNKSKKGSFEDERFQLTTASLGDDIPILPDLDDVKEELLLNEIAEPPSVSVNRVVTLKELNSDLLSQNAFSAVQDVDLSILTRCLQEQENLDEPDEVWEWEKLFTEVTADIHSDKKNTAPQKIEIGPDEVPPITQT